MGNQAGTVVRADVMKHDDSGKSKGFGICEYSTAEEAANAVQMLNDAELDGRPLEVQKPSARLLSF